MHRLPADRRPWAAVGALLVTIAFLAPRALGAQGFTPWPLAVAALVAFTCGFAIERTAAVILRVGRSELLVAPLAAVALLDGALAIALAVYVEQTTLLLAVGAFVAGLGTGACPRPRGAGRGTVPGLITGASLTVVGPIVVHAVSSFAVTRNFHLALAATTAGKQFATVLAAAVVLWGVAPLFGPERREPPETGSDASAPAKVAAPPAPGRPAGSSPPLLEIHDLHLSYGTVPILFGVSFHLAEGEALALLGTNGAGKSSVLRAVFGLVRPTAGTVRLAGEDITGRSAEVLVRQGLVQVPGGRAVFPSLTVRENLRAAGHVAGRRRITEGTERTLEVFPQLASRLDDRAGLLSGGEQQMLALGRAWITRPRILAIDELTLGLAPIVVDQLIDVVQTLQHEGVSLLLVDQSVVVARRLCERAIFLERGSVRFDGSTADLADRSDLLRSMFFADSETTS